MKILDAVLRSWRINVALRHCPSKLDNVFDIGCDDGYLLSKFKDTTQRQDGVDPRLHADIVCSNSVLKKGRFPGVIDDAQMQGAYDAIFALAAFEHFSEPDLKASAAVLSRMLSPGGRLIVTVPHPFVDKILAVLFFLRLIDAIALDEHHGFNPDDLLPCFSGSLKLVKRERFQFGLNNVFVFKKS